MVKLPSSLFKRAGQKSGGNGRAQNTSKKASSRVGGANALEGTPRIEEDEDLVDTGSGTSSRRMLGADGTFSAGTTNPLGERAHIINKGNLDQKALAGPGSLDPDTLAAPTVADARRWLAKRGVELLVPEGWRFLGTQHEGRGISFNHIGAAEGHSLELTTWRLADDTPLTHFTAPYLEEAEELARLGRLASHEPVKLGDAEGVLLVGWGPDSQQELSTVDPEALFLATDGTGRRTMSWRGAVQRNGESQLYILSMSSPIETFFEARAVYDAVLRNARIVA